MIDEYLIEQFSKLLGGVIGVANYYKMPFKTIEKTIVKSDFYHDFIEGNTSFINSEEEVIIQRLLKVDLVIECFDDISLWCGEAYTRLILNFKKGLDYIFIYMPIKDLRYFYNIYHEMGWSQLFNLFLGRIKKKTLLNCLIKDNLLTKERLALLSGVNINTIKKYSLNDEHLYNAPIKNINKLARVLNVDLDLFVDKLSINYDDNYSSNKEYFDRMFGVYLVEFIEGTTSQKEFEYYEKASLIKDQKYIYYFDEKEYLNSKFDNKKLIKFSNEFINQNGVDGNTYIITSDGVYSGSKHKFISINQKTISLIKEKI